MDYFEKIKNRINTASMLHKEFNMNNQIHCYTIKTRGSYTLSISKFIVIFGATEVPLSNEHLDVLFKVAEEKSASLKKQQDDFVLSKL